MLSVIVCLEGIVIQFSLKLFFWYRQHCVIGSRKSNRAINKNVTEESDRYLFAIYFTYVVSCFHFSFIRSFITASSVFSDSSNEKLFFFFFFFCSRHRWKHIFVLTLQDSKYSLNLPMTYSNIYSGSISSSIFSMYNIPY